MFGIFAKMITPEDLLRQHGLRSTNTRINVVNLLRKSPHAISHPELEQGMIQQADRVTLYRTLKSLEEKGIIHRILDNEGISRFAVCKDACTEHQHADEHIHFQCHVCGNIYCISIAAFPAFVLPQGYVLHQLRFNAEGICKACN